MLRIRGRTLRDESLETNTARDLEQVVRMFVEMDVGPVSPSSTTTGCEGEWSAFDPLPKLMQASDKDVRIIVGKERESYEPEDKKVNHCEERSGLNHTSSPLPFPPISITIELTRKRSFPYAQKSCSWL